MIKASKEINSFCKKQEPRENDNQENHDVASQIRVRKNLEKGVSPSRLKNNGVVSPENCCYEQNQSSTCCYYWKDKHDSLERLLFDMEEEWSLKEEKAFALIAELRFALRSVVLENDDLMVDVKTLINSCESLNKSNKRLRRENRSLKNDHDTVTGTIRHLIKEVEAKEIIWKDELLNKKKGWKNQEHALQQELQATKLELERSRSKFSTLEEDYVKQRERVLFLEQEPRLGSIGANDTTVIQANKDRTSKKNPDLMTAPRRGSSPQGIDGRQQSFRSQATIVVDQYHPLDRFAFIQSSAKSGADNFPLSKPESETGGASVGESITILQPLSKDKQHSSVVQHPRCIVSPHSVLDAHEDKHLHAPSIALTKSLKRLLHRHHNGSRRRITGSATNCLNSSHGATLSEESSGSAVAPKECNTRIGQLSHSSLSSNDTLKNDPGKGQVENESSDQEELSSKVEKSILDVSIHTAAARARRERMDLQKLLQTSEAGYIDLKD